MGSAGHYAITRVEIAKSATYGWQVRLQRRGVKYAKFFADNACGGIRESFVAASTWRDALLSKLDEKKELRVSTRSVRNQSGVVGVSKVTVKGPNGVEYLFWQAAWSPRPGVRKTIRYSVKQHGSRVAFRMAVKARREAAGD